MFGISTFTEQVFALGAVWLASAATFTVTVAFPSLTAVTVTVFPLTLTVTTPLGDAVAETAPVPFLGTVMLLLLAEASRVMEEGERASVPAAF